MIPAVEIIANMLFSGLAIHFMNSFLVRGKRAARYKMALGWAVYFLTVTFLTYPKGFEGLSAISYGAVLFLYARLALKGKTGESLVAAFIWNIIITITSVAALLITNFGFDRNLLNIKDVDVIVRLGELISVFFLRLILIKLVIMLRETGEKRGVAGKRFSIIICLFYFCMWINVMGILLSEMNPDWKNRNLWVLLLLMELTVCVILLFYLYERWNRQEQEKIKNRYLERMNEEQHKYIEELLTSNEETRVLKHDLNKYFYIMNTFLDSRQNEECRKYLDKLSCMSEKIVCGDSESGSVDIIMQNRKALCGKESISFQYSILANWKNIDEMDLCVLLLNMMDNAVEAERKESEKAIRLEISNYKGYLKIECRNRIEKSVLKRNPGLHTSKNDGEEHGIGLLSIRKTAEKYDGWQAITEEDGYFVNTVYLRSSR